MKYFRKPIYQWIGLSKTFSTVPTFYILPLEEMAKYFGNLFHPLNIRDGTNKKTGNFIFLRSISCENFRQIGDYKLGDLPCKHKNH